LDKLAVTVVSLVQPIRAISRGGRFRLGKLLGEDLPLEDRLERRRALLASEEESFSSIEIDV
jgi:hypothetical protein